MIPKSGNRFSDKIMRNPNVRPCANADEMRAAFAPIWHYFGRLPPTSDAIAHFSRIMPQDHVHAGFDGDQVVAGSGAYSFDLTVPGGRVPAMGLTIVGVLPTHTRRGYLTGMIRSQIDAARARGEAVALHWATEDTIYGRFGYGIASMAAEMDLPREHAAAFAHVETPGQLRLITLEEAEPLVAPVYERVTRQTPGMYLRSSAWWQDRLLIDHPWRKQGQGDLRCAVWEEAGRATAYAFYRVNQSFERGSSAGHVFVLEAMGETPQSTHAIWRFLIGIDFVARIKSVYMPLDHVLLTSLAEPRRLNFVVRDGLWLRLLDVGAALSARGYASDDAVVIDVTDAFVPENAGRWCVTRGKTERTTAPADLACDVVELGCVYLGGFTFAQLARSLRVRELREGAIARADGMFRSDRMPWCPELF
jgi:predicted acetyltransferase